MALRTFTGTGNHYRYRDSTVETSVADPGWFIPDPDPTIAPSRIRGVKKHRIPDPGGKRAPDPGSGG
jgi:hypothetical protein